MRTTRANTVKISLKRFQRYIFNFDFISTVSLDKSIVGRLFRSIGIKELISKIGEFMMRFVEAVM